jgi:hypothetical protein
MHPCFVSYRETGKVKKKKKERERDSRQLHVGKKISKLRTQRTGVKKKRVLSFDHERKHIHY